MKKILATIIITMLSITGSALAATSAQPFNPYSYMSAGVGTFAGVLNMSTSTSLNYQVQNGGIGLFLSYGKQATPNFAYELDAILGHFDYTDTSGSTKDDYSVNGILIGPALKAVLHFDHRVFLSGKVGVGFFGVQGDATSTPKTGGPSSTSTKSSTILLPFDGITLGYSINHNTDVQLDYSGLLYGVVNAGLVSLGMTHHFA